MPSNSEIKIGILAWLAPHTEDFNYEFDVRETFNWNYTDLSSSDFHRAQNELFTELSELANTWGKDLTATMDKILEGV